MRRFVTAREVRFLRHCSSVRNNLHTLPKSFGLDGAQDDEGFINSYASRFGPKSLIKRDSSPSQPLQSFDVCMSFCITSSRLNLAGLCRGG